MYVACYHKSICRIYDNIYPYTLDSDRGEKTFLMREDTGKKGGGGIPLPGLTDMH